MAKSVYQWTAGSMFGQKDAQAIGEVLEQLGGNGVTAHEVLNEARDKKSPLHDCFEWDDSVAAEKHRLHQARQLLSNIRVVQIGSKEPQHVFVNVTTAARREYVPVTKVMSDAELYQQVLVRARADIDAFERRYAEFEGLKRIARSAQKQIIALQRTKRRRVASRVPTATTFNNAHV